MAEPQGKVSVELPGVDFGALARQVIAVEVSKALSIPEVALNNLVMATLMEKVGSDGKPSHYSDAKTFIEWAARSAIREAVLSVLKTRMADLKPQLEKAIEADLKKNAKGVAMLMSENFIKQTAHATAYGFELHIAVNPRT